MLKGQDIICVSTIDWDSVWQGHQEIMTAFARNGNRVLFIENTGIRTPTGRDWPRLVKRFLSWRRSRKGIREVRQGLFVYSPLVLPFPYAKPAQWLNKRLLIGSLRRWMGAVEFREPIIWTYLPTRATIDLADSIRHKLLVYYCVADFAALADSVDELRRAEESVIRRSDIVFAQGKVLAESCGRFNGNVHVFPGGVNTAVFDGFRESDGRPLPPDMRDLRRPILGYIGGVHKHIDFRLLRDAAELRPEWTIVLVGPPQADLGVIAGVPNIKLLGPRTFADLPAYVAGFDVCLIPYQVSPYTMTVYPTKLNEYHAMGKPVVSTGLPEVLSFNEDNAGLVHVASDAEGFVREAAAAMRADDARLARMRVESARRNRWETRIEDMCVLIAQELSRRG